MPSPNSPSEILRKWRDSSGAERSNAQAFLIDVCRALDVDPPNPATSDPERDDYVFEKPVAIPHDGRKVTIGRIDLYKRGHFVLEAKQGSHEGSRRIGVADRNTPRWQIAMQDAFGQALKYARHVDDHSPFVVVTHWLLFRPLFVVRRHAQLPAVSRREELAAVPVDAHRRNY